MCWWVGLAASPCPTALGISLSLSTRTRRAGSLSHWVRAAGSLWASISVHPSLPPDGLMGKGWRGMFHGGDDAMQRLLPAACCRRACLALPLVSRAEQRNSEERTIPSIRPCASASNLCSAAITCDATGCSGLDWIGLEPVHPVVRWSGLGDRRARAGPDMGREDLAVRPHTAHQKDHVHQLQR